MTRACAHCGATFRPATEGPGKNRRYCTESCRKRRWDNEARGACQECGATLSGASAVRGVVRCRPCEQAYRAWRREFRLDVMKGMYRDGWPLVDIAEALGRRYASGAGGLGPELRALHFERGVPRRHHGSYDRQGVAA